MRIATPDDASAIDALMKASAHDLFPAFYDEQQTASSVAYIAHVDRTLLEDGTYFVLGSDGDLVACGGWSRRDKLFSGSTDQEGRDRLLDPAPRGRARPGDVRPRRLDPPRPRHADP